MGQSELEGSQLGLRMTISGDLTFLSSGENGGIGYRKGVWLARGPCFASHVLLEDLTPPVKKISYSPQSGGTVTVETYCPHNLVVSSAAPGAPFMRGTGSAPGTGAYDSSQGETVAGVISPTVFQYSRWFAVNPGTVTTGVVDMTAEGTPGEWFFGDAVVLPDAQPNGLTVIFNRSWKLTIPTFADAC